MATTHKHKKNLIVSYKNLADDLKELFKEAYPEGYKDYITKFVKPNGEAIFVVPFETDDTAYMVKFDVKIDTLGEDLDKALFDDDGEDTTEESEFDSLTETREKEEGVVNHREEHLRHGDFEDVLSVDKKKKTSLGVDKEGLKDVFDNEEEADELDSYDRIGDEESEDDDFEPSDEDLRGIEDEFLDDEIPPLDAVIPEEEIVKIEKPTKKAPRSTVKAPSKTTKAPAKTPAKAAVKSSVKATVKAPVKATVKTATKPAAKTPKKKVSKK